MNLGNVVGLIVSQTPPAKKYVLWAKILDINYPEDVQFHVWDKRINDWTPRVEGATLPPVIGFGTTTPPTSPSIGDAYLVPSGASGAWASKGNYRAEWNGRQWLFIPPKNGYIVTFSSDLTKYRVYGNGIWNTYSSGNFYFTPVSLIADLRLIDTTDESVYGDGGLIFCAENNSIYSLDRNNTTGVDDGDLIIDTDGVGKWEKTSAGSGGTTYTFSNGVNESSGTVKLGGDLTQNTTIGLNGFTFTIGDSNTSLSINPTGGNFTTDNGNGLNIGNDFAKLSAGSGFYKVYLDVVNSRTEIYAIGGNYRYLTGANPLDVNANLITATRTQQYKDADGIFQLESYLGKKELSTDALNPNLANDGQFVYYNDGSGKYELKSAVSNATNGLTNNAGVVELGGTLTKNTNITGAYTLGLGTVASKLTTLTSVTTGSQSFTSYGGAIGTSNGSMTLGSRPSTGADHASFLKVYAGNLEYRSESTSSVQTGAWLNLRYTRDVAATPVWEEHRFGFNVLAYDTTQEINGITLSSYVNSNGGISYNQSTPLGNQLNASTQAYITSYDAVNDLETDEFVRGYWRVGITENDGVSHTSNSSFLSYDSTIDPNKTFANGFVFEYDSIARTIENGLTGNTSSNWIPSYGRIATDFVSASALSGYAKLDGSNTPFTGAITIKDNAANEMNSTNGYWKFSHLRGIGSLTAGSGLFVGNSNTDYVNMSAVTYLSLNGGVVIANGTIQNNYFRGNVANGDMRLQMLMEDSATGGMLITGRHTDGSAKYIYISTRDSDPYNAYFKKAIIVGDSSPTTEGAIRFNSSKHQFYNGTAWHYSFGIGQKELDTTALNPSSVEDGYAYYYNHTTGKAGLKAFATTLKADATITEAGSNWSSNTNYTQTITVTGAAVGDVVTVNVDDSVYGAALTSGGEFTLRAWVTSANTVKVWARVSSFINVPPSTKYYVVVHK